MFRAHARAWLKANFPSSLFGRAASLPDEGLGEPWRNDLATWKSRLISVGWSAPTWPAAMGGGGLTSRQSSMLRREFAAAGAWNPMLGMGLVMLGPTLLEFGSEAQKAEHLPPIVRGERRWCQGFSEPGAGSDLASLQTRAVDDGDAFLVRGQKLWTSGAQYADWCFALVRTDPAAGRDGISFLLVDMRSPGVSVRPLRLISGGEMFCELFFDGVRVPKANLVGELNGGWRIAKRLLEHERTGGGELPGTPQLAPVRELVEAAVAAIGLDATGRLDDGDFRVRLARHHMDAEAYRLTARRLAQRGPQGQREPSAAQAASFMKNARAAVAVNQAELLAEVLGAAALGGEQGMADAMTDLLFSKSLTLAGGSEEVQYNIIAKRILGLPEAGAKG